MPEALLAPVLVERERPIRTFAYQRVGPTMQQSAQPHDGKRGTGFSHLSCHPRAVTDEEPPPG